MRPPATWNGLLLLSAPRISVPKGTIPLLPKISVRDRTISGPGLPSKRRISAAISRGLVLPHIILSPVQSLLVRVHFGIGLFQQVAETRRIVRVEACCPNAQREGVGT